MKIQEFFKRYVKEEIGGYSFIKNNQSIKIGYNRRFPLLNVCSLSNEKRYKLCFLRIDFCRARIEWSNLNVLPF